MSDRSALLLGATGLVGRRCLDLLLSNEAYASVTTLGRRSLGQTHPKLHHHVVDFDELERQAGLFAVDDVYCCLGTTMKQAGSREAFRTVDFTYPYEAATLAHREGAGQYLLVSALGADAASRIFYNRVKGEVEAAIGALPFYGVYAFRPSLLLGERADARTGERIAENVLGGLRFVLQGPLRKYRAIPAGTVAQAMIAVALDRPGGVRAYESDEIARLAS